MEVEEEEEEEEERQEEEKGRRGRSCTSSRRSLFVDIGRKPKSDE